MRKIILGLALFLVLSTVQAFEGGSGAPEDPYQISNCQQLQDMQDELDAHYEIVENVDCSGESFDPVGSSSSPFTGSLNGNPGNVRTVGYTVSGLEIDSSSETGLFGATSGQVTGFSITDADVQGSDFVGVLTGIQEGGYITDIRVENSQLTATGSDIGGLVGKQNSGTISYSYTDVDMDVGSANDHIGNFVGFANGGGNNNKAVGSISSGGAFVGGFVGRNSGVDQTQSFAAVNLGDPQNQQGFGPAIDGTGGSFSDLSTSYFDNTTSDLSDTDASAGSDFARGLPTPEVTGESAETEMTQFNFGQEWASANQYPIIARHHFESGSGTEADPYEITTCRQLQNIQKSLHNHYEITENIDCSETENWNGGSGFQPIGNSTDGFTGSIDGRHYMIEDLYIDRPDLTSSGFIGYNEGFLENLEIVRAEVVGELRVGITSGYSSGTITNSKTTGEVRALGPQGDTPSTGGVVGRIEGGVVNRTYSIAEVADGYYLGGIAGSGDDGTIEDSYAGGVIYTESTSGNIRGGLIGNNILSVRNSFAMVEVVPGPTDRQGGAIGVNRDAWRGSYTDVYYDTNLSGFDGDDGNASSIPGKANVGENLTTADMTIEATTEMDPLDYSDTWESTSFYYPKLNWQEVGSGTSEDPYMIEDCQQLQAMQNDLNAHYRLANDIDCSMTEYWNDGKGFHPVGDNGERFNGVFNGDGHVIYNLTIDRPSNPNETGLFGYITSSGDINRVRKVGLENVDIQGGGNDVGGLIGQNDHNIETVRKSYVTGNISGGGPMGALIGTNFGQILDSYARANITGSGSRVGGLVGQDSLDPVVRSYFTGSSISKPVVGRRIFDPPADTAYWDMDTTGIESNPDDHGAEPLRNYEMTDRRAIEYMEGFNFTDTWVARDNDRYPELAVFTEESGFSPGVDQPPGLPTLLSPDDGQETVPIDPNLTAELYHPQDESMDVDFLRPDGSNIGSDSGGSLDTVNSVWDGRESGTSYNWSLVIEDSTGQTLNVTEWIEEWRFTTIYAPDRPETPDPSDGEAGVEINSNLTAFTSQNDGLSLFSDLYLTNNSSDARNEFDLEASDSVSGSGDVEFNPATLDNATDYSWFVNSTVTDSNGNTLWNASPTWEFRSYESPEPDEIMPVDGETGLDPQPRLNVSVDHSQNLTVDFYDFQSNTLLGTERIENGNWANISTDSFSEYSKSQTHYWYVEVETDSGETWNNNNSQAYSFTVSNVEGVSFDEKTEDDINLDPGTADLGQEELRAEVTTPNEVTMEEIAFNISNSTDYEITANNYDVESGETVTANISEASIVEEDGNYEWYAFYREGSNVIFNSSERTFSTYVAQLDWVPTSGNYEGGDRETINIYYSESSTGFEDFDYSGSVDYGEVKDTDSLTVANPRVDSGDQACYQLTVENLLGESSPEGDCIGGVP